MENQRFRTWETAALIALCLTLLWGCWAQGRQNDIAAGLVRLHVLAVSDAPEEQAVKLRVRDAVLECLAPRLADVHDADEAGAVLASSLDLIRTAAESAAGGRAVRVSLGEERYPTRGDYYNPDGYYPDNYYPGTVYYPTNNYYPDRPGSVTQPDGTGPYPAPVG